VLQALIDLGTFPNVPSPVDLVEPQQVAALPR